MRARKFVLGAHGITASAQKSPNLAEVIESAVGSALPEHAVELETRVAKPESDVSHLRADVGEIKADLRTRFDRVDTRIDQLAAR